MATKKNSKKENSKMDNSLADFAGGATVWGLAPFNPLTPQNSRLDTVFINTRWNLISNYRSVLSEAYAEYGIVQTLVEQPVSDAFSRGFDINTEELSTEQKRELQNYLERHQVVQTIQKAIGWSRLFGGGGVIIVTDQKPDTPLDISKINTDTPLSFIDADMWELYKDTTNIWNPLEDETEDKKFSYYGMRLDRSRVLPIIGKEAPSFIRPRLRGWGMSELERVVRSINSYLKNQDLIFELLDEAKIDVYQLNGFNRAMLTPQGTKGAEERVRISNTLKSYLNALVLDVTDKYEQKQLSFNGLSDILNQIRQGVAADLKMPMTKLFGVSAAGFNSGEDDIENYNAMIESEIRSKVKYIVVEVLEIVCQKLFGFVPNDLNITFKSLRILSAEQEENMKDRQFNRVIQAYTNGMISLGDALVGFNSANLLPVQLTQEQIKDYSAQGITQVGLEKDKKGRGLFGRFFGGGKESSGNELGINYPNKPEKGNLPTEQGRVKEQDVTSNKFVRPDREKKPLPSESFPYKGKRKERYIRIS